MRNLALLAASVLLIATGCSNGADAVDEDAAESEEAIGNACFPGDGIPQSVAHFNESPVYFKEGPQGAKGLDLGRKVTKRFDVFAMGKGKYAGQGLLIEPADYTVCGTLLKTKPEYRLQLASEGEVYFPIEKCGKAGSPSDCDYIEYFCKAGTINPKTFSCVAKAGFELRGNFYNFGQDFGRKCVTGGFYCGGDRLIGQPDSLYRCDGTARPPLETKCAKGCQVNDDGKDDACK